ncbi:MAG: metallopeptidase family protein [Pseudomonadota bacterium]
MYDAVNWTELKSPSLGRFEAMAKEAFQGLPEPFRALCGDTIMRVAEFPDGTALASLGLESPFDLLGMFEGVGLAQTGLTQTGQEPNRIWLFRRPILDYWAEHDETLGAVINHVLVHEIGHHFGLSDQDMETIESLASEPAMQS